METKFVEVVVQTSDPVLGLDKEKLFINLDSIESVSKYKLYMRSGRTYSLTKESYSELASKILLHASI